MRNKSVPQSAVTYTTHQGRHRIENTIKGMDLLPRLFSSHVGYFVSICISLPVCVTTNTAGLDTLEHLSVPKPVGKTILTGRTQLCVIFQLIRGCHPSCLS